jgi:hypothetical protein
MVTSGLLKAEPARSDASFRNDGTQKGITFCLSCRRRGWSNGKYAGDWARHARDEQIRVEESSAS